MEFILDYIVAPCLSLYVHSKAKQSLPQLEGIVKLPNLKDKVEIKRDEFGIAHIYAQNEHDLFFTQGYVTSQDRLWQMETARHVAAGRLSEILPPNPTVLESDKTARLFGWRNVAEKILKEVEEHKTHKTVIELLQAYSDGVNAFVQDPKTCLPVEFNLIKLKKEQFKPWTVLDSLVVIVILSWSMSFGWYSKVVKAMLIKKLGPEAASEFDIKYPNYNPVQIPKDMENVHFDKEKLEKLENGEFFSRYSGSNWWVLDGSKTETGKPILSNDPHLINRVPGVFYEIHLHCPTFHCTGASLAGYPWIIIGHNERIAWGITLSLCDVEDLFIEEFVDATHYKTSTGEIKEVTIREETINIKNSEPFIHKVISTDHGIIIDEFLNFSAKDLIEDKGTKITYKLAHKALYNDPGLSIFSFYFMNISKNWDEFLKVSQNSRVPSLNINYADVEGNIGYRLFGLVPVRNFNTNNNEKEEQEEAEIHQKNQSRIPVFGTSGQGEWNGYVPWEEMPCVFNPKSGYIISANNKITTDDYPYYLGSVFKNGFRAARIQQVIESKEKLSIEDCKLLQNDVVCIPGIKLKERILNLKINRSNKDINEILTIFEKWDGNLTSDSIGGTIYEVLRFQLVKLVFPELEIGSDLFNRITGNLGFNSIFKPLAELGGNDTVFLLEALEDKDPESYWIKKAGGRVTLVEKALMETAKYLKHELGSNPNKWQWGKLHHTAFSHSLSAKKPLGLIFNPSTYELGGDGDCVNQLAINFLYVGKNEMDWDVRFQSPVYRQIIDLSDFDNSVSIVTPGQCGIVGSPHYEDLLPMWVQGKYHPMYWSKDKVDKATKHTLICEPKTE